MPRLPHWLFERMHGLRGEPAERTWITVAWRGVTILTIFAIVDALRFAYGVLGDAWAWVRWIAHVIGVTSVLVLIASPADAASEARCVALAGNCYISEPMNTPTYTDVSGGQFFSADDTTTKKGNISGITDAVIEDGSGFRYIATNSGEAITALPAGHTNSWILRTKNDGTNPAGGGQFLGGKISGAAPTARRAVRFYKYYSTDYEWVGGACLNTNKIAQVSSSFSGGSPSDVQGPVITETAGTWSFYAVETSTHWNQDGLGCCAGNGPGAEAGSNVSLASLRGKWIRYEFIIRNAAPTGTPTTFEFYRKNVTDGGPEYKYVDSSVPTTMPDSVNWTTALATTLHPDVTVDHIIVDWFRNGTCAGFAGLMYYMAAAWSTDDGQRILAASEVEGGAVVPSPVHAMIAGVVILSVAAAGVRYLTQVRAF